MIFVNGQIIASEGTNDMLFAKLKEYVKINHLVIVDENDVPIGREEIFTLIEKNENCYLKAVPTSQLLSDFYMELNNYIDKVESYVEAVRDNEGDLHSVHTAFINIMEALMEFAKVQSYVQTNVIDFEFLEEISSKAFQQAQHGNLDYILDLIDYEIIPVLKDLQELIKERI